MAHEGGTDDAAAGRRTTVERVSDRELVVRRRFDAPVARVYAAWTRPELLMRWWAPRSMGVALIACDVDARTGGSYRFAFGTDGAEAMAFFGRYLEVVPPSRLVWTNEESADGAVTTVTFEPVEEATQLVMHERYPTEAGRDEACAGMEGGTPEQFDQLDALLAADGAER